MNPVYQNNEHKKDEEITVLVSKDKEIFSVLIERYEKRLARYMRRLGVHANEDVEDLLQTTFIKAYRNINGFNVDLSFSSWIYRIAHNETVSFFRSKSIRPEGNMIVESDTVLQMIKDDESDVLEEVIKKVDAESVGKTLLRLDDKYRSILVLRYFEGLEYVEISDILRIPLGSVATLIHRAKKKLKEELLIKK
jgi:RNA polymerase sigma-70 factor (ECF subfamily)